MEFNPYSLLNKTILVTGASSGIGRSIAIECSKMGANVIITARNEERLKQTLLMMQGSEHQMFVADLVCPEDVEKMVHLFPEIDGIVHNAGMNRRRMCSHVEDAYLHNILGVNLKAPILLQKSILKSKKLKFNSSVVFISSMAALRPSIGNSIYSAAKGGITSYAQVLALELAPKRIRVNCIHCGSVWTEILQNTPLLKEQYLEDEKRYPLGRYGQPEDIAYLAIYLLSNASSWMTGSSLCIDGGGMSLV